MVLRQQPAKVDIGTLKHELTATLTLETLRAELLLLSEALACIVDVRFAEPAGTLSLEGNKREDIPPLDAMQAEAPRAEETPPTGAPLMNAGTGAGLLAAATRACVVTDMESLVFELGQCDIRNAPLYEAPAALFDGTEVNQRAVQVPLNAQVLDPRPALDKVEKETDLPDTMQPGDLREDAAGPVTGDTNEDMVIRMVTGIEADVIGNASKDDQVDGDILVGVPGHIQHVRMQRSRALNLPREAPQEQAQHSIAANMHSKDLQVHTIDEIMETPQAQTAEMGVGFPDALVLLGETRSQDVRPTPTPHSVGHAEVVEVAEIDPHKVDDVPVTDHFGFPQYHSFESDVGTADAQTVEREVDAPQGQRDVDSKAAVDQIHVLTSTVEAHTPHLSLKVLSRVKRAVTESIVAVDGSPVGWADVMASVAKLVRYLDQYKTSDRRHAESIRSIRDAVAGIGHCLYDDDTAKLELAGVPLAGKPGNEHRAVADAGAPADAGSPAASAAGEGRAKGSDTSGHGAPAESEDTLRVRNALTELRAEDAEPEETSPAVVKDGVVEEHDLEQVVVGTAFAQIGTHFHAKGVEDDTNYETDDGPVPSPLQDKELGGSESQREVHQLRHRILKAYECLDDNCLGSVMDFLSPELGHPDDADDWLLDLEAITPARLRELAIFVRALTAENCKDAPTVYEDDVARDSEGVAEQNEQAHFDEVEAFFQTGSHGHAKCGCVGTDDVTEKTIVSSDEEEDEQELLAWLSE